MITYFTFAGKNSQDFKVYISGQGTYNAPARVYTTYKVPGRSGDLFVDEQRYENIDVTYPAFIFEDMRNNLEGFRNFLLSQKGYQRLEDTYHPDEYRMAVYKDGLEVGIDPRHEFSSFEITFNCKPQRFLKSGDQIVTFTSDGSIYNPTAFESKPIIRVYGEGQLGIGSDTITITPYSGGPSRHIDIDCELMDCRYGTINFNANVLMTGYDFPTLKPGTTNFSLGNGISKLEITPRWWRL